MCTTFWRRLLSASPSTSASTCGAGPAMNLFAAWEAFQHQPGPLIMSNSDAAHTCVSVVLSLSSTFNPSFHYALYAHCGPDLSRYAAAHRRLLPASRRWTWCRGAVRSLTRDRRSP